MKLNIFGIISLCIIFIFSVGATIHEGLRISKINQSTTSTKIESDCSFTGGDDSYYRCFNKYTFEFNEKEYTCSKNESSRGKKEYTENKTIYFSTNDPSICSVDKKSNDILTFIIADVLCFIALLIIFIFIKKNYNKCK